MTKSHSEFKRPWSVMPMRSFKDRELKERELRVLGALCCYTNKAGVCWPSMDTLCQVTGYAERKTVHEAMKTLKRKKYVRQLNPKDYQAGALGWKSNRYQVLWTGKEPVPSLEDIHIAKPLQPVVDQDETPVKEKGGVGDVEPLAHILTHAYLAAVQRATGQVRLYDNELAHGRRLALDGWDKETVYEATLSVSDQRLKRRAGVPSLYDVAVELSARNVGK